MAQDRHGWKAPYDLSPIRYLLWNHVHKSVILAKTWLNQDHWPSLFCDAVILRVRPHLQNIGTFEVGSSRLDDVFYQGKLLLQVCPVCVDYLLAADAM